MIMLAYMAHGSCYLWQPRLIGLHSMSDGLTMIAYFSIAIALLCFVLRRQDLPYRSIFWLFSAFIFSCGLTHLLAIWTLWHPDYWLSAAIKAFTAWISIVTAVYLIPILPKALALPSIAEVQALNDSLKTEIAERLRIEDSLRRYERIVSASSDGISLLNRDYVYQIVNDTYAHYIGKPREDIVDHSVSELLGEKVFAEIIKPNLDACLGGETVQYESWFEFVAMERQFMRVTYSPYRELDGTTTGIVARVTNLTDLKQAEQALQESEWRFQGIFDQMYQFIGLLSPDGTLLEVNHTTLDFCGLTRDEVLNRPFLEMVLWTLSPATQQQLQAAIVRAAQGELVRYEVDVMGHKGQVITLDFSIRPIFNDAGDVVLLIPEGHDITDRINAEKQLQLQAVITRTMAEGICLVRADNGTIVYANPKFEQMFGYESGELNGQHVSIVNYDTEKISSEAVNQAIRALVLTNKEATYEVHNIKKDGTPFWCQATTSVFDHPDYGPVLVAVQQDVSDRKEAQEKVKAFLKEELLLKEIYHRVKNNLQVIYSLLDLHLRKLTDSAAKIAIQDSQSRIRAMALVHEKLYQTENLTCIDLGNYARSLVKSLIETYHLQTKNVTAQVEIESCWLDIDTAVPCGLILTELISNSLKYAFPDDAKGKIRLASSITAEHITLTIKDDGIGLSPYLNLQTASSLGLNLVRNLAKQIRGQVTIIPTDIGTELQLSFQTQKASKCLLEPTYLDQEPPRCLLETPYSN